MATKCFVEIIDICTDRHLTVDQIFEELKMLFPKIGRSSVYRNVELLVSQDQLKKLRGFGQKTYFEAKRGAHAHFISKDTNEIIDISLSNFHVSTEILEKYRLDELDIRLFGSLK